MNGRGQQLRRRLTCAQQNKHSFVHLYSSLGADGATGIRHRASEEQSFLDLELKRQMSADPSPLRGAKLTTNV